MTVPARTEAGLVYKSGAQTLHTVEGQMRYQNDWQALHAERLGLGQQMSTERKVRGANRRTGTYSVAQCLKGHNLLLSCRALCIVGQAQTSHQGWHPNHKWVMSNLPSFLRPGAANSFNCGPQPLRSLMESWSQQALNASSSTSLLFEFTGLLRIRSIVQLSVVR